MHTQGLNLPREASGLPHSKQRSTAEAVAQEIMDQNHFKAVPTILHQGELTAKWIGYSFHNIQQIIFPQEAGERSD